MKENIEVTMPYFDNFETAYFYHIFTFWHNIKKIEIKSVNNYPNAPKLYESEKTISCKTFKDGKKQIRRWCGDCSAIFDYVPFQNPNFK